MRALLSGCTLTDVDWQVVVHYVFFFPFQDDIIPVVVVTLHRLASVKVTACRAADENADLIHRIGFCCAASQQLVGEWWWWRVDTNVHAFVKEQGACIRGGKKGYCPASVPSAGD